MVLVLIYPVPKVSEEFVIKTIHYHDERLSPECTTTATTTLLNLSCFKGSQFGGQSSLY